ncbi:WxcM-like, C-terminal [Flavobacteriaceae bacterium MAR_2010_188]|nr:WxcM-like, C-terminal [Flavobacteriaceae bacterium MAR_2010_188]
MSKKKTTILDIPNVHEERGKLAVIEKNLIPFEIKRVYYLYDIPSDAYRGGHAHRKQESFMIPLSGSFDVLINDGKVEKKISLNKPNKGLYIPTGVWRELENFSSGAVCLVLASTEFEEEEYIREKAEFLQSKDL